MYKYLITLGNETLWSGDYATWEEAAKAMMDELSTLVLDDKLNYGKVRLYDHQKRLMWEVEASLEGTR